MRQTNAIQTNTEHSNTVTYVSQPMASLAPPSTNVTSNPRSNGISPFETTTAHLNARTYQPMASLVPPSTDVTLDPISNGVSSFPGQSSGEGRLTSAQVDPKPQDIGITNSSCSGMMLTATAPSVVAQPMVHSPTIPVSSPQTVSEDQVQPLEVDLACLEPEQPTKKVYALACFFCRKRKIACGSSTSDSADRTCW